MWAGETVAVLASGPSLTAELAESVREHRCIVVNHSCRMAPWADMLVALDGNWPQEFRDFAGMRVTGVEDEDLDALYIGPSYERITLAPGHVIETRNSGLTAIRIAAAAGAAKILLLGFDPETRGHWYDDGADAQRQDGEPYPGLTAGLNALISELRAGGIVVERIALPVDQDNREGGNV
jgi:hypothetical protein